MTRIQFADLPLLEDLTPEQLKELFGAGLKGYKPSFEQLEDRWLMSGFTSVLSATPLTAVNAASTWTSIPAAGAVNPTVQAISANTAALQSSTDPFAALLQNQSSGTYIHQKDSGLSAIAYAIRQLEDNTTAPGGLQVRSYESQEQGRIAIAAKVAQLGARLGSPLGESQPTKDGNGRFQSFTNGQYVIWSKDIGQAHLVEGLIGEEYVRKDAAGHNRGLGTLGYPKSDALPLTHWTGAYCQDFWNPVTHKNSTIVWTAPLGAHTISNAAILNKWIDMGTERNIPISQEYYLDSVSTGQDFLGKYAAPGGSIAYLDVTIVTSKDTGTHDVAGPNRDLWVSRGKRDFGLPVTDSTVFDQAGNRLNQIVYFKNFVFETGHGAAISTTPHGTFAVIGAIYDAWMFLGGAQKFGQPLISEYEFRYNNYPEGTRASDFVSPDGIFRRIVFVGETGKVLVDYGYGGGLHVLDFTPGEGPTGTSNAPLTVSPHLLDPSTIYQDSLHATNPAWTNWLSANSLQGSTASLWQGNSKLQAASTNYASLFAPEMQTQSLAVNAPTAKPHATASGITVNSAVSFKLGGLPAHVTAGAAFHVTVTALDAAGKKAVNYRGVVHLSSSDGHAGLPAAYTFTAADHGVHTFTVFLKTAAHASLTVSDKALSTLVVHAAVVVTPSAAKTLVISGLPASITVGTMHQFTVTAKDAFGNVATGYLGTVSLTSSDKRALLPAKYTFKAADKGVHVFSVTFKTTGIQSLAIGDLAVATLGGKHAGIAVTAQHNVAAEAAKLVKDYGLGSYHPEWTADNWLGRNERWILSKSNQWYFITPDGGLYKYGGSKEAAHALLGMLDHSYWEHLDKLLKAA